MKNRKNYSIQVIAGLVCVITIISGCSGNSGQTENQMPPETSEPLCDYPCLVSVYDNQDQLLMLNEKGDTIVPAGKYAEAFTDTIKTFGTVYDANKKAFIALDLQGKEMYEVFPYDNGPDYLQEGYFRIVKENKIGFAREDGSIAIEPQYACAYPFENGTAMVSFECTESIEFEMIKWESDQWFYIDTTGTKLNDEEK
ncbi:MAG: hypothetical protein IPM74_06695 [Crocinitomicaceae bacterium]|nr:hypothetical protein [Crocinitomicaceae bacterium]MBK8925587.1 hypothetical protein [Crocinitomicaceae bacterium]